MDKDQEGGVVVTSQMSVADDSVAEKPETGAEVDRRQYLVQDDPAQALPDTQRSEQRNDAGIELQPI